MPAYHESEGVITMSDKAEVAKKSAGPEKEKRKPSIARFFREYRSEFRKIVWPTRKTVVKNTWITILMVIIVSVFVCSLDLGLTVLIDFILKR